MSISLLLILLTVAISYFSWKNSSQLYRLMLDTYAVRERKEYFRLITSGFVHLDWNHLIFNMFTFYFFGGYIERVFDMLYGEVGKLYFIVFYLLAIVISDLPTLKTHWYSNNYRSLGASGGVSAVLFAAIVVSPLQEVCMYMVFCLPGIAWGGLYIAYTYYQMQRNAQDGINHSAHFYGAAFGIATMMLLLPSDYNGLLQLLLGLGR